MPPITPTRLAAVPLAVALTMTFAAPPYREDIGLRIISRAGR